MHKDTEVAHAELQEQAMSLKFVEIGKVMLVWGILKNVSQVDLGNHGISFIQEFVGLDASIYFRMLNLATFTYKGIS